jgi:hypothetical protein
MRQWKIKLIEPEPPQGGLALLCWDLGRQRLQERLFTARAGQAARDSVTAGQGADAPQASGESRAGTLVLPEVLP